MSRLQRFVVAWLCTALLTGLASVACSAEGEDEDVAAIGHYELSLFGYHIGMSYDEATAIRPFHRIEYSPAGSASSDPVGVIENLHLAGIDLTLLVYFLEDRVHKVLGRFPPQELERMLALFRAAFGPGEDRSRILERIDGSQAALDSYLWQFPGVSLNLVRAVGNNRYATASMHVPSEIAYGATTDSAAAD